VQFRAIRSPRARRRARVCAAPARPRPCAPFRARGHATSAPQIGNAGCKVSRGRLGANQILNQQHRSRTRAGSKLAA
jgi:hypothetical protein